MDIIPPVLVILLFFEWYCGWRVEAEWFQRIRPTIFHSKIVFNCSEDAIFNVKFKDLKNTIVIKYKDQDKIHFSRKHILFNSWITAERVTGIMQLSGNGTFTEVEILGKVSLLNSILNGFFMVVFGVILVCGIVIGLFHAIMLVPLGILLFVYLSLKFSKNLEKNHFMKSIEEIEEEIVSSGIEKIQDQNI